MCLIPGADEEEDAGVGDLNDDLVLGDEACDQLRYKQEELRQFMRYIEIYVNGQKRLYEGIIKSLPQVKEWHLHNA